MALLFLDSFDHYLNAADKYTAANDSNVFITTGRHGNGMQIISMYISFDPVPQSNRCLAGAAFRSSALAGRYFTLSDQGNTTLICDLAGDGAIEISLTGADGFGQTPVVARSAADVIKLHQWNFIELDVTQHWQPSGGYVVNIADVVKVWVDGELVLDAQQLGPTSPSVHLPSPFGWNGVTVSANAHTVDDYYVCDGSGPAPWNAPLGDVQVNVIRPNGAGVLTQWAALGGPTNFGCVRDQTPDDDATRVIAPTAGPVDLYQFEDINTNNRIIGAQLLISARRTEEGYATLTPLLRHAGTTSDLRNRSLSPTYFYRNRDVFVTMPNGDPLTDANVAALQAGFRRDAPGDPTGAGQGGTGEGGTIPPPPAGGTTPPATGTLVQVTPGPCQPRMYSYWPNACVIGASTYVFAGTADGRGTFWRIDGTTVTTLGALLPYGGTTEGWYWDAAGWVYVIDGPRLLRINPLTQQTETKMDISSAFPGHRLWQAHSSDDGQVHSATLQHTSSWAKVGTVVNDRGRLFQIPAQGTLDESAISMDGRYVVIKENDDNRIVTVATGAVRTLSQAAGALGHSDNGANFGVGEDDAHGACVRWDFDQPLDEAHRVPLFNTWNMGHVSVRAGRCLLSNTEILGWVDLTVGGVTEILKHGAVVTGYDSQVRANLSPDGTRACYMVTGAVYVLFFA